MIKLGDIAKQIVSEGGKLFGARAVRLSSEEMNLVFNEVKEKLINKYFTKFNISKSLKSKDSFGDIDIVCEPAPIRQFVDISLKNGLGLNNVKDYSKNGNIYSVLYHSDIINKDVHIDFLVASGEDYDAQFDYLSFNDFSGILGVLARRLGYSYSSEGFFKVYVDKKDRHHKILISKNLRDGLQILGYGHVMSTFDDISTPDDIVKFISSSPFFDSKDYQGQDFNHSDRKRVRAGRPTADYVRQHLIMLNKHRSIDDFEYYLKKLYPDKYQALKDMENEIENQVSLPPKKYDGNWLIKTFNLKPSPIINQIKNHWKELFGDNIDDQTEEIMIDVTQKFLNKS